MTTTIKEIKRIGDALIQQLRASLRGNVILPGDASYEEERKVYNGMIEKYPSAIAKCSNVADVIACVKFAKQHSITLAICGGKHNAGGLGSCNDGLVADLSPMKGIRVNQSDNTVRVEAGCLLGDIDHALQPFGKAVPSGILSSTGIAGLTLGGGVGHLSRAYGLTIDSLLEVDIVLADGRLLTANDQQNADLFWAVKGGGGNFGVVTSFLFKMHDAGIVYGGPMLWPIEETESVMRFYRDYILTAPKNEYCYFAFVTVPPADPFPKEFQLKKMCGVVWCNIGDINKAADAVNKFRTFKKPAIDFAGPIPYAALQGLFDALYPKGLQWYWKADFIKDLSNEAIKVNYKHALELPTPSSTIHLYPINGACHDKKNSDTAFSYRDANWAQVIVGVDPNPIHKVKLSMWAKEYWDEIHPYSAGGAYINFMMEEGQDRVKASYRDNYNKLAAIKAKYDPENFFKVNQNIQPQK